MKIKNARHEQLDEILELYSDRTQWFKDNNIKQWSKYLVHHPKEEFVNAINNNELYVIENNNEIIGAFELSKDSRLWNDTSTPAMYIYKIVIKIGHFNKGKTLINFCKLIAKIKGTNLLRIDHLRYNEKLNEIYNGHGFEIVDEGYNDNYNYYMRELCF